MFNLHETSLIYFFQPKKLIKHSWIVVQLLEMGAAYVNQGQKLRKILKIVWFFEF